MKSAFYREGEIENLLTMVERMRKCWTAVVHHAGNGCKFHDSHCLARIYSDGLQAVVILTELKSNKGTSVTNAYEVIARQLRHAVKQFIFAGSFPSKVTWLEQYEARPEGIDLVTLRWSDEVCLSPPTWKRIGPAFAEGLGIGWEELIHVPEQ